MSLRTLTRAGLVLAVALAATMAVAAARQTLSVALALAGSVSLLCCATAAPIVALRWFQPLSSAMMRSTRKQLARRQSGRTLAFEWVDLSRISPVMCLAAIAAEDAYFRNHSGFDWESIREARVHNQSHVQKRGASTITQQVAKNLFLWSTRSYVRKLLEAYLTTLIEALWPKRRILEMYLNIAQFGDDLFGVEAAAHRYFDKAAAELDRNEAALLAAALPNPVTYRVSRPSHQLRFRQSFVLASMRRLGDRYLERL
jgi:monofunctional biosynthetic peptidoglycan transglycosylase